jgi:hypothetical protein
MRLSVIVGGGADLAAASHALSADLRRVSDFAATAGDRAVVEMLETRLPDDVARGRESSPTERAVEEILTAVAAVGGPPRELCIESPGAGEPAARDILAIRAVAAAQTRGLPPAVALLAYKLRCGGVEPAAFPSCRRIADVLVACRDANVPLKATAGLHHPVRHRAVDPPVMMHGFLNVFGAGLLVHALGTGAEIAEACLAETDPAAFSLAEGGFAWREHGVMAEDVARIRQEWLLGFGSCSFDEPRDDLRGLGWLG